MHNNNTLYIHLKKGEYCYLFVKYRNKIHKFNFGDIIIDWVDYIEFIMNINMDVEVIIDQSLYDYLVKNPQYNILVSNKLVEYLYGKGSRSSFGFVVKRDMVEPIQLKNYILSKKRKKKIISLFDDIR
jgi:hypothetical protein